METFKKTRIFLGPMSQNIVDTIMKYSEENKEYIGVIPSRRQIEYNGGYVNNWTTKDLYEYTKNSPYIILERDHGGIGQGAVMDDGIISMNEDTKYFNIIHIDPWKYYQNYEDGFQETLENLIRCYSMNPDLYFEVGTEEAIRPFTAKELDLFLHDLQNNLPKEIYDRIIFVVIQSGTSLKNLENIGNYQDSKLLDMITVVKKYRKLTKEHNGDWMKKEDFVSRFENKLDGLNIAPELGTIETKVVLEHIKDEEDFEKFFKLCVDSGKWKKWVSKDFVPEDNKRKLIEICGHYVFSKQEFNEIKNKIENIDEIIKERLYKQLKIWFTYIK